MKILSYNINQCSQEKLDAVINMGADIMILFECANKPLISIPDDPQIRNRPHKMTQRSKR